MPLHRRTHPELVEGCFACKISSVSFEVPPWMRSVPRAGEYDCIDTYDELKRETQQMLREDTEGRFQKA